MTYTIDEEFARFLRRRSMTQVREFLDLTILKIVSKEYPDKDIDLDKVKKEVIENLSHDTLFTDLDNELEDKISKILKLHVERLESKTEKEIKKDLNLDILETSDEILDWEITKKQLKSNKNMDAFIFEDIDKYIAKLKTKLQKLKEKQGFSYYMSPKSENEEYKVNIIKKNKKVKNDQ